MFPEQLKKILNLIKKTGDRVVIYDSAESDDSYVVMGLDSYANLRKINNEGKSAENYSGNNVVNLEEKSAKLSTNSVQSENLTGEDLTDKINREISAWKNNQNADSSIVDDRPKKAWSIPSQVKNKAQEVE